MPVKIRKHLEWTRQKYFKILRAKGKNRTEKGGGNERECDEKAGLKHR